MRAFGMTCSSANQDDKSEMCLLRRQRQKIIAVARDEDAVALAGEAQDLTLDGREKRQLRRHGLQCRAGSPRPGYRVYFGKDGEEIVILLGGGTKQRQQNDISLALDRWKDYKQRKKQQKEEE